MVKSPLVKSLSGLLVTNTIQFITRFQSNWITWPPLSRDFSASKTRLWDSSADINPRLSSSCFPAAKAKTKSLTRKKSAPPWPLFCTDSGAHCPGSISSRLPSEKLYNICRECRDTLYDSRENMLRAEYIIQGVFAFRRKAINNLFSSSFSSPPLAFLRLLLMLTSISEYHLLFWYSWTLLRIFYYFWEILKFSRVLS